LSSSKLSDHFYERSFNQSKGDTKVVNCCAEDDIDFFKQVFKDVKIVDNQMQKDNPYENVIKFALEKH